MYSPPKLRWIHCRKIGRQIPRSRRARAVPPSIKVAHPMFTRRTSLILEESMGGRVPGLLITLEFKKPGVPHPCVFCKGGPQCCVRRLVCFSVRLYFGFPPFAKNRTRHPHVSAMPARFKTWATRQSTSGPQTQSPVSWRNRAMSLVGALPKKRLYSRLNCEALR